MAKAARGIQSIEVSGRILGALVATCKPMMLKDLAQAAGIAPAQCHAYLTSLRHVGFVHQDGDTGLYRMGPFAMRLGIGWLKGSPLSARAIQDLKTLTDDIGTMSLIAVWGEFGPTIVHINVGAQQTALNLRQGTLFSVTGTATGRVFAAFGTSEAIGVRASAELETPRGSVSIGSVPTREDFMVQVEATRAAGFSTAKGAPVPGINAVAAPIFDERGVLQMVATLVGPSSDLSVEDGSAAVLGLLATTRSIAGLAPGRGPCGQPTPVTASATAGP